MLNKDEVARVLVMIAGISSLALQGCRRVSDSTEHDTIVDELNRIKPAAVRLGVGDRVESVLSMRRNGVVDARPFLVYATLADPNREPTTLALCLYDEDVDVLGLAVQEEHVSSGGEKTTLLEDYPVFVHRPASGAYDYRALPVRIRREGQRKDAELWDHYVTGKEIDSKQAGNPEYYQKTLPPVWMSLPKPNELDVRVYLYDRAGNKSEAICPVTRGN